MNIDPTSERYGEIVAWESLTDAEKRSGHWIKLPVTDENGEVVQARRQSLMEKFSDDLRERNATQSRVEAHLKRKGYDPGGIWTGGER